MPRAEGAARLARPVVRPAPVDCPACGRRIFDGEVIRSRCVKVAEGLALCRCKGWVRVPVSLSAWGAHDEFREAT
jgi:hypothetical protein